MDALDNIPHAYMMHARLKTALLQSSPRLCIASAPYNCNCMLYVLAIIVCHLILAICVVYGEWVNLA